MDTELIKKLQEYLNEIEKGARRCQETSRRALINDDQFKHAHQEGASQCPSIRCQSTQKDAD